MIAESTTRVLLVEDNAVVRSALAGIILRDPALTLVGQVASGETAVDVIKALKPDVVCLDVMLPRIDGLTVLQDIRRDHPSIRVVMVTANATAEVVKQALELGARGFVVKPFNAMKVLGAIHAASR